MSGFDDEINSALDEGKRPQDPATSGGTGPVQSKERFE